MITDFDLGNTGIFQDLKNATPWSVAASWMLIEDQWEVALRYQDTQNVFNESDTVLGVNYYVAGHDVMWQADLNKVKSDDSNLDGTWRFGLGLNVRI